MHTDSCRLLRLNTLLNAVNNAMYIVAPTSWHLVDINSAAAAST